MESVLPKDPTKSGPNMGGILQCPRPIISQNAHIFYAAFMALIYQDISYFPGWFQYGSYIFKTICMANPVLPSYVLLAQMINTATSFQSILFSQQVW